MDIIKENLFNYLYQNRSSYSDAAIDYIVENFYNAVDTQIGPDILRQVLSALDLYKAEYNVYLEILKLIKKYFTLDKNILEIGAGHYPALSHLIDKEQTILGKGTITAYDKDLIPTQVGKIIYNRTNFTNESLVPYDLIIGAYPCEATELIIRKCNTEKKPFFLATCGCVHLPKEARCRYRNTAFGYHTYLEDLTYETLDKEAEITVEYLDSKYCDRDPIFIKTYKNN